ncbi:MAG: hypothetical protein AAF950_04765 [Pseudomonadota bacterium]
MRPIPVTTTAIIASAMLFACQQAVPVDEEAVIANPVDGETMTFFLTSAGPGKGADLGGLEGADAHCASLASKAGAPERTWRAYLSTASMDARDRIGTGPWVNARGIPVAAGLRDLIPDAADLTKATVLSETGDIINGRGDSPNRHDILTGSDTEGRLAKDKEGTPLTCAGWTSSGDGRAMVGHHDRVGGGANPTHWSSAHPSRGCSQSDLQGSGGDGLFYCFAID